jgi:cytochrome c-type biogenesis protein CcmI
MLLWLVFGAMTLAAMFAVLLPLRRNAPLRSGSDTAVYRDQLEEIERDRASGLIGAAEAEAARLEVSRRLLAAAPSEAESAAFPVGKAWGRRAADFSHLARKSRLLPRMQAYRSGDITIDGRAASTAALRYYGHPGNSRALTPRHHALMSLLRPPDSASPDGRARTTVTLHDACATS